MYLKNKTAALAIFRRMGDLLANSELESFTKRTGRSIRYNKKKKCKVPVIVYRLWRKLNFLDRFSKNTEISVSQKSVQWEPSCSVPTYWRMDGQTNTTKQIERFVPVVEFNTSDGTQQVASPSFLSEDRKISNCRNVLYLLHKIMDTFHKLGNPKHNIISYTRLAVS